MSDNTHENKIVNLDLKMTESDKKLEKKIKDLETKLDKLNNPSQSDEENKKDEEKNIYDKYELSDISKAFLNSYLDDGSPKPELSDYSKAYMTGISEDYTSETTNNERPVLSGLTMEFLKDTDEKSESNKMEEIIEEKDE